MTSGSSSSECVWRGRAPLRIGLAGGGTDLSPYCDQYGGAVLNVAIKRFAHAFVARRTDGKVVFDARDLGTVDETTASAPLPIDQGLALHRGIYNRLIADFNGGEPLPITLTTSVDCPQGSGLGASSSLTVAMVEAFSNILGKSLDSGEVARLAFEIERRDVGLAGGRQDQYAAAFGGMNFMEFAARERILVNPIQLDPDFARELESSLLLCFTGVSRRSGDIIQKQVAAIQQTKDGNLESMHKLKQDALEMKVALLHGDIVSMAEILNRSWQTKKSTASGISSSWIDELLDRAVDAGALAGTISGAGGGGFMVFI
ncbi:MAG: dehydrogenase, partial [Pseudomonadota bacterium]